jgi:hypothetical protein
MPFFYTHMPLTWTVESDEYLFSKKFLQACNIVLGYPQAEATQRILESEMPDR